MPSKANEGNGMVVSNVSQPKLRIARGRHPLTGGKVKGSLVVWTALLLYGLQTAAGQAPPWLTDRQAREVATAAIHAVYPQPCYSTYRNERLENFVVSLRINPLTGNHVENSVYFYRVASNLCEYVVEENGKPVPRFQATSDCCEYGIVAVDRGTAKSYWFSGEKNEDVFMRFSRDEQLHPDSPEPILFFSLYREVVWGGASDNEITSVGQLRNVVEENFRSAYSPYQRDNAWQRKFDRWWRNFLSKMQQLKLETTFEPTSEGTMVRGYAFNGFLLTIPRIDPPPKRTPQLSQWTLLVKHDGTVERLPSTVVYEAR